MIAALPSPTLSVDERSRLDELERVVDASFHVASRALREIKESRLYREMGTWEEYCHLRWNKAARIMDYRITAANMLDEMAERTKVLLPQKEVQTRQLIDVSEEDRVIVWEQVVDAYTINATANQVALVIERLAASMKLPETDPIKRQVFAAGYKPIIEKMNAGRLKPKQALAISDALSGCDPVVCQDMLRLEASDPAFIRTMNRQYAKRSHETYDEIVATGFIQPGEEAESVPVSKATGRQLGRYLQMKHEEYRLSAGLNGVQSLVIEHACVQAMIVNGQQMFMVVPGAGQLRLTVEWR